MFINPLKTITIMKRFYFIIFTLLLTVSSFGQYRGDYPSRPTTVVYKVSSVNETPVRYTNKTEKQRQIGIITRFGYSFSDYFDYGASLFYKFNPMFGIIVGADGASKVHFSEAESFEDAYKQTVGNISQWDVRMGAILGKYFGCGVIYGNCKVCTSALAAQYPDEYSHEISSHSNHNIHDIGGFATILLPINNYIGFDVDFAYTQHTYFNISAGIILSLPLK